MVAACREWTCAGSQGVNDDADRQPAHGGEAPEASPAMVRSRRRLRRCLVVLACLHALFFALLVEARLTFTPVVWHVLDLRSEAATFAGLGCAVATILWVRWRREPGVGVATAIVIAACLLSLVTAGALGALLAMVGAATGPGVPALLALNALWIPGLVIALMAWHRERTSRSPRARATPEVFD